MGSQGFRNIAGNPFVYQEDTRSAAFGLDAAAEKWKVVVSSSAGALPTGTAQITIDPAAAGDITIAPAGTGKINLGTASYPKTVAIGDVLVASAADTVGVVAGAATSGYVLTANGAGTAPTFQAAPASGIQTLAGDSGTATGSTVTIAGGSNITTSATSATVTVDLDNSPSVSGSLTAATGINLTSGICVLGNTEASIAYPELSFKKSRGGAVITTGDGLGEILFTGNDGTSQIIGAQITSTSSGTIATNRVASDLQFYTHPDSTSACALRLTIASTGACTIASPDSGVGLTISGGGETITSGDLTLSSGNLKLPTTTSSVGQIQVDGHPIAHFYNSTWGSALTSVSNVFMGFGSGTTFLAGATGSTFYNNVAIGTNTLYAATNAGGGGNVAIGGNCMRSLTTGTANVSFGGACALNLVSGSNNVMCGTLIAPGNYTGDSYTGSESSNILIQNSGSVGESNVIRIGTSGSGNGQQNKCYMAGIYGVTPGGTLNAALVDSNGQLGSVASLGVANGGTGAATLTDHGILLGSGTGAITPTAAPTDGQLLIGYTGSDPSLATLTAGTNVTVTNGSGSITLASTTVGINTQTDSYTLVIGDAGKLIRMNKATANTLTIPKNASVAFATGTVILVEQVGAGQTTIAPVDGDVTINSSGAMLDMYGQYSVGGLIKTDTDVWVLFGDIS